MFYDVQLADRVRAYLAKVPKIDIEEKKMFGGLAFMVNGKMCVNVSGENLVCPSPAGDYITFHSERAGYRNF